MLSICNSHLDSKNTNLLMPLFMCMRVVFVMVVISMEAATRVESIIPALIF